MKLPNNPKSCVCSLILLSCFLQISFTQEHEKGNNVHVLPSVAQTLLPDKQNTTSDGQNTTVPSKPQIFPIYDTSHLNGSLLNSTAIGGEQHDTFHHHGGQWGKEHNESCNHETHKPHDGAEHSGKRNHTCHDKPHNGSCAHGHEESSAEKVEQILWDIFTEEMEDDEENDANEEDHDFRMSSDEREPETEVVEEVVHDEVDDSSSNELSSNEEIASDSHVITKRSAPVPETPREARKTNKERKKQSSKQKSKTKASASAASVKKYNEYMDVVLKRMNTMIKGKNMDPLMVNLFSGAGNKNGDKKNGGKKKNASKGKGKGKKGGKNRARMETEEDEIELDNDHELTGVKFMRKDLEVDEREVEHDGGDTNEEEDTNEEGLLFRNVRALILNGSMKRSNANATENTSNDDAHETRGFDSAETGKKNNGATKSKNSKKPNKGSGKNKSPGKKPKQQATRGILKGLSSLRRTGNVDVIRQGDKVRIVRSKFLLGPVMLEIVPKNTRTPKAEEEASSPSSSRVTAVASQLKGIIEVRLKKQSPTTIKRLRVFPPSSVKIKSSTNSKSTKASVPRYSRVTPVATNRLRQIASAVVRQADLAKKATHT